MANPVRLLRLYARLTQKQLAQIAGTSQPTIADYEAGRKSPTLETLTRLAGSLSLELSVSYAPKLTREDRRSLEYHRVVMTKLNDEPDRILAKARTHLASLISQHPDALTLLSLWRQWLDLPRGDLVNCCLDAGLLAREMRQVTPFAGVLSAKERVAVLKGMRTEKGRE